MNTMVPCRILLRLMSPVVLSAMSPSLDGILFEALSQRAPGKSDEEILLKLKSVLAFNESLGVFHASSLQFGVSSRSGLIAQDYYRVDYLHEGKRTSEMFSPNGARDKYRNIIVAGGPTKKRLTGRPAYSAPYAVFDAMGDPRKISDLLKNTFVGVGYDAQNVGMGHFDTDSIEIIQLEEDVSLVEKGLAKRCLPEGYASGGEALTILVPPYYRGDAVACNAAKRVSIINIENI